MIRPQGALAPALEPEAYRDFRGYAGMLADGSLSVGDPVGILSNGYSASSRVKAIGTPAGPVGTAQPGEAIVLELEDEVDIARGDTVVAGELPQAVREFDAEVCILAPATLAEGQRVLLKHGTKVAAAKIGPISHVLDVADYSRRQADTLGLNDLGRLTVRSSAALSPADYRDSRAGGSFLLIDPATGRTLAAGIIGAGHAAA